METPSGSIADRAVLECFYGPLWTPEAREHVLRTAADAGATAYVYGPAGDPRTGAEWRNPYGAEGAHLAELTAVARERGVKTFWRVSPGAPLERSKAMRLDDPAEIELLCRRIGDAAGLGFGGVLIAFDDLDLEFPVEPGGGHPIAAAHAEVLNRAARHATDLGLELLACPTHYWGTRTSRYREVFAERLLPDVPVCWTGDGVTATRITAQQLRTVAEQFQHPIWLWDNYPVNDWNSLSVEIGQGGASDRDGLLPGSEALSRRLPLAPLTGREPELAGIVAGYGANAAQQAHAGLPALLTALEWARAPFDYRPDRAFAAAAAACGIDAAALRAIAEVTGGLPIAASASETVAAVLRLLMAVQSDAGWRDGLSDELSAACAETDRALAGLHDAAAQLDGAMGGEIEPWLVRAKGLAEAGRGAVRLLRAFGRDAEEVSSALRVVRAGQGVRRQPGEPVIADGLLDVLIEYSVGAGGAGSPPWPDGPETRDSQPD